MKWFTEFEAPVLIVRSITNLVIALVLGMLAKGLASIAQIEKSPTTAKLDIACGALADAIAVPLACLAASLLCVGLARLAWPIVGRLGASVREVVEALLARRRRTDETSARRLGRP